MVVGFGSSGLGVLRAQTVALIDLLKLLPVTVAIHRGEAMIHNHIREVYPSILVHVLPIIGVHSVIASVPQGNTVYKADTRDAVNRAIVRAVWGIIVLEDGDLARAARDQGVPVIVIGPTGKMTVEKNDV